MPVKIFPWDLIVVPFPYLDQAIYEKRPALVVSDELPATDFNLVWVLMITGQKKTPWQGDVAFEDSHSLGLTIPSMVRCAKLTTIETSKVVRKLGMLPAIYRSPVSAFLERHLLGSKNE